MAFEEILRCISLPCATDLSGAQYHAVKVDGSGEVVLAAAADANVIGILQNNPIIGETATVAVGGVSKAYASAAIASGAQVGVGGTDGQLDDSSPTNVLGVAIAGGAADTIVSVLLEA